MVFAIAKNKTTEQFLSQKTKNKTKEKKKDNNNNSKEEELNAHEK